MSWDARRRRVALIAAVAFGLTTGMGSTLAFSLGTLMPHLVAAKGWARGDISFALTLMTLGIFVAGPVAGRLGDRFGAAQVGAASLVGYALLLIAMSRTLGGVEQFWAWYFVMALVGAGSTPIVLLRPITARFVERRGLAIGLALTGAGLAGFWLPIVVQYAATRQGWQGGYAVMAAAALTAAPLVWLALGGEHASKAPAFSAAPVVEAGLTLAEAVRTGRFWLLAMAGVAMAIGVAGLVVHLVPLLTDLRVEPAAAAATASLIGLASVFGRLCVGFLLDRLPAGLVAVGVLGLSASGAIALLQFGAPAGPVAAVLLGFAAGSEVDLVAFLTARYFGQRAYGAIFGWQYSIFALGYGLSPFLVGRLRDANGNYDAALMLCVAAMAAGAVGISALARRRGAGEHFARSAASRPLAA